MNSLVKATRAVWRILLLVFVSLVLLVTSSAPISSAQGFLYPFYDPESRACGTSGNNNLTSAGMMSLRFPGFSDKVAMGRTIEEFIRSTAPDSPWLTIQNLGTRLIDEGERLDVNPLMIVVIGRKESQFGTSGDSSLPRFNSFGDKVSSNSYRDYGSWERSLFGGDGTTNDNNQSFTSRVAYRLNGHHSNYAGVTNMYEYLSVHLTGRIFKEGDGGEVYDPIMGTTVNLSNVIDYHDSAKEWIGEMTGQTIGPTTNMVSSCTSTGVVNGNIVETALALAWTDANKVAELMAGRDATDGLCSMEGGNPSACGTEKANAGALIRERDARPEYVSAVKQYNPGNDSDSSNWAFSDCGVFVATVMRASGVDPSYAARSTTENQLPYVQESPMYDTVLFTDTSQLMPGDILIKPGHTAIYVGQNSVTDAVVVQASWGQHVPAANQSTVVPGDGYYRVRKVQ